MNDKDLIWKELSKKEILKTPVMTVMETDSVSPEGDTGHYIVMEARDWCTVIPETDDSFLMVKQYRHALMDLSIEFPGGVIDDGEEPLAAAIRELHEETGFYAKEMIYLGSMSPNPALFCNKIHYYLARNLYGDGKQNLDSDEFVNAFKVSKKQVYEKMGTKEYPHALMAAALNFYRNFVEK